MYGSGHIGLLVSVKFPVELHVFSKLLKSPLPESVGSDALLFLNEH